MKKLSSRITKYIQWFSKYSLIIFFCASIVSLGIVLVAYSFSNSLNPTTIKDNSITTENLNVLNNLTTRNLSVTGEVSGISTSEFLGSYSAIVYKEGNKIIAKKRDGSLITEGIAGRDDARVINSAISSLTSGRTWKEVVALFGSFTLENTITVPSYTVLDLTGAKLIAKDLLNANLITNDFSVATQYVDIIGGIIDGNKDNQTAGSVISFANVSYSRIINTSILNSYGFGIYWWSGGSNYENFGNLILGVKVKNVGVDGISIGKARDLRIIGCEVSEIGDDYGIVIGDSRDVVISNCVVHDCNSASGAGIGIGSENANGKIIIDNCDSYNNKEGFQIATSDPAKKLDLVRVSGIARDNTNRGVNLFYIDNIIVDVIAINNGIHGLKAENVNQLTIRGQYLSNTNYGVALITCTYVDIDALFKDNGSGSVYKSSVSYIE